MIENGHYLRVRAQIALRRFVLSILPLVIDDEAKADSVLNLVFKHLDTFINHLVCKSAKINGMYCNTKYRFIIK